MMGQLVMEMLQMYALSGLLLLVELFPVIQGTMYDNLQMGTTCNLQMDSFGTDGCHAQGHSAYPVYNCRPCGVSGRQEVHIINMHQPSDGNVPVTILANHPVHIKLLLSSHQTVHWKINKPRSVKISNIIMTGVYNVYSSVALKNGGYLNVTLRRRNFRLLDGTGIIDYARSNLGPVTSFSAAYTTCGWWITVGYCKTSSQKDPSVPTQVPDAIWTLPDLTDCTGKLPCWIKYDFSFPLKHLKNQCAGDQYVTWYKMKDTTFYVGAVLCTNSKYSLFMSTSLRDKFLDIADSDGQGEDHCELVGTDREYMPYVKIGLESTYLYGVMGYSRDNWGEHYQKVEINIKWRPRWYECGITIPYSKKLYSESDIKAGSKTLSTGVIVGIVITVLILVIILAICYRKYQEKRPPQATYSEATQDGVRTVMSPNTNEHMEPSAPGLTPTPAPSAPMLPDLPPTPPTEPLAERLVEEGAPPAYEDAMNYPLAKPKNPESLPPPYEAV